jgi:hypothetical protein
MHNQERLGVNVGGTLSASDSDASTSSAGVPPVSQRESDERKGLLCGCVF